jgi:hypothetical protein
LIDLLTATESASGYTARAWTGVATDEGVGLICMVEVSDARGVPVCRFEEFLSESVWRSDGLWPAGQRDAATALQRHALGRAGEAVFQGALQELHGHRYDLIAGAGG